MSSLVAPMDRPTSKHRHSWQARLHVISLGVLIGPTRFAVGNFERTFSNYFGTPFQ